MDPANKRDGDDTGRSGETGGDNQMNSVLEGQLLKFTSILKGGFLPRWFVLDPLAGTLTYYLSQDTLKKKSPRGCVNLLGAQVSPSDEDSQTFFVNIASGEIFKLKAHDAKERQLWVSRLRHVVEILAPSRSKATSLHRSTSHGKADSSSGLTRSGTMPSGRSGKSQTDGGSSPTTSTSAGHDRKTSRSRESSPHGSIGKKRGWDFKRFTSTTSVPSANQVPIDDAGPLQPINQACTLAAQQEQELRGLLEQQEQELRKHGGLDVHSDPNVLLMKATAQANLAALQRCMSLLVDYQQRLKASGQSLDSVDLFESDFHTLHEAMRPPGLPSSSTPPRKMSAAQSEASTQPEEVLSSTSSTSGVAVKVSATSVTATGSESTADSVKPVDDNDDETLDSNDLYDDSSRKLSRHPSINSVVEKENRGNLLRLCSSLKLGMNLTTVTFPVSLLDGRSILELFADLFSHSQLFLQVAEGKTPCERMMAVVRHYICGIHTAFQHQPVRKPYNAQLGETFQCELLPPARSMSVTARHAESDEDDHVGVNFVAEQVSHHPPVSAFHAECPKRGLSLTADVCCRSKFLGMSAGVDIDGQGCLKVAAHNEEYIFTFPSVYCRSILTNPWMEFSGRVRVTCPQSAYQATITFPAKPSYGDEYNKVTAEIRPQTGSAAVCKISGRWDGVLTVTRDTGETEVMDINHLSHGKKVVRPLREQSKMESRRLWRHVTASLRQGDNKAAEIHKQALEDVQREEASQRLAKGTEWKPKFFSQVDNRWQYHSTPQSTDV